MSAWIAWGGGIGCLVVWGALWLLEARWRALPAYHRPRLTHSAAYPLWAGLVRKAILGSAFLLLLAAQPIAAVAAALALGSAGAARILLGGPAARRREMQRSFDRLREASPAATDMEILYQVIYTHHQRWGPDLVQQIVQENPTVEGAARMVVRLEREITR